MNPLMVRTLAAAPEAEKRYYRPEILS